MSIFLGAIKTKQNVDHVKVRETILFAENDERSLRAFEDIYVAYLKKKKKAGKYDRTKALKLLEYFYQNYVRPEMVKPSKYGYDPKLNPAERVHFAEYFRDNFEDNY